MLENQVSMQAVFRLQNVSPIEKVLLLALCTFVDSSGACKVSNAELGFYTCLHERTVRRAIGKLQKLGLIERLSRGYGLSMLTRITLQDNTLPSNGNP